MAGKESAPASRSVAVYQKSIRNEFAFLKRTTRLEEWLAKSIRLADDAGVLLPVCDLHLQDSALIETLSAWRKENYFAYPSQFPVTNEGTASWLKGKLLEVDDRILFLVLDHFGNRVGHLGFANCLNDAFEMEIDNVIRGVKSAPKGVMSRAMRAAMDWAFDCIGPLQISLRVFQDNPHAVDFYRKLAYKQDRLIPLRKHLEGNATFFRDLAAGDSAAPDRQFVRMVYTRAPLTEPVESILTAGPSVSAREQTYVADAARAGWNRQWSGYLKRFEAAFNEYLGTKYAMATSSGTGALHLALAALGIGPGDEVIVPDLTWVATANAVKYVGATPVFADVQAESWCLDPASFETLITSKTKAVMPVHIYGHPAQMDAIVAIARKHKLYIVEDAAPAAGAEFNGKKVGTYGDFACFSFQGAKLLVTGEGGMLVTSNEELYQRVQLLWDQGRDPHRMFWINQIGFKYKMANVQAAFGLGQLERVEQMIEAKRRIFGWYTEGLSDCPNLTLCHEASWARSIYWMSNIVIDERGGVTRDQFREQLSKLKVDSRPCFPAISQYPMWQPRPEVQPIAKRIGDWGVNLPSGVCLRREQVDYVCRCIQKIMRK